MRKFVLLLLCCVFLLTGCGSNKEQNSHTENAAYEITDYRGSLVKLPHKPKKILTDSLGLDEIVLGLVSSDKLAGINYLDRDPAISFVVPETKNVSHKLKTYSSEEIIALQPDVFFATTWTEQEKITALRKAGITVVVCQGPTNVQGVKDAVSLVAEALDEKAKGQVIVKKMTTEMAIIEQVIKQQQEPQPVVILVSLMTNYGGTGSLFDVLCQKAGLVNGIAKVGIKNGEFLAKELVVKANPDLFILSATSGGDASQYETYKNKFMSDPAFAQLKGINNTIVLPDKYIYCSSQNIVYGIKHLANEGYGKQLFPLEQETCIKGW